MARSRGRGGARTSRSASGARSARTTATTATRGTTSPTTRPARAPTAGARTAWPASPTTTSGSASRWRCGTARDPILKERLFGLTNSEGNHGEDVKEYYFYLDSTPTHSYMKYLYKYPQAAYPYDDLVATNRSRGRNELEYELLDTGVFDDDRYFDVVRRVRQGVARRRPGPDHRRTTAARSRRRCTCCRRCGSATPGRGAASADGPSLRDAQPAPARVIAAVAPGPGRRASLHATARRRCCSPRTRPTPSACSAGPTRRRTSRTASTTTSSTASATR